MLNLFFVLFLQFFVNVLYERKSIVFYGNTKIKSLKEYFHQLTGII